MIPDTRSPYRTGLPKCPVHDTIGDPDTGRCDYCDTDPNATPTCDSCRGTGLVAWFNNTTRYDQPCPRCYRTAPGMGWM